jgi:hypothetical protein
LTTETKKNESITTTEESGTFYRKIIREGKKTKTVTIKIKDNESKVILGYTGALQIYVYPYSYPDKVFIGKYPISTVIEKTTVQQLMSSMNIVRWFLEGNWQNTGKCRKNVRKVREMIQKAYNNELKRNFEDTSKI